MKFIPHTILSIAALVMIFSLALVAPSQAAGWNHMHEGSGWTTMHESGTGYGPHHGMMQGNMMHGGMMHGGMMGGGMMHGGMMGQGMMGNGFMHGTNHPMVQQCEFFVGSQPGNPTDFGR